MRKIVIPYDLKVCPASGKSFVPRRENQIYIDRATQIKHNNEQGKLKRAELIRLNHIIKQNAQKLSRLYSYMLLHKIKCVPVELIEYEQLDFNASSSQSINTKSRKIVNWCLDYGYEPCDEKMAFYFIYKR
jgi:hypothetical protein